MKFSLYGIADQSFMSLRSQVLAWLKNSNLDYSFEECTSLDRILSMGIKDIPCLMMNNQIIEFNSFRGPVKEVKLKADKVIKRPIRDKRMMVALDFTKKGVAALNYAGQFALKSHFGIDVLHVVEEPVAHSPKLTQDRSKHASAEKNEEILNFIESQSSFLEHWDAAHFKLLIKSGCPVEQLLELSFQYAYAMILMAWDPGSGNFPEYLHGHSTGALIQLSNVPLLMIPLGFDFKTPKRFILPIDDLKGQGSVEKGIPLLQSLFDMKLDVRLNHPDLHSHLQTVNEDTADGIIDVYYLDNAILEDPGCGFKTDEDLYESVLVIKTELFSQENLLRIAPKCLNKLPVLFLNESRFTRF